MSSAATVHSSSTATAATASFLEAVSSDSKTTYRIPSGSGSDLRFDVHISVVPSTLKFTVSVQLDITTLADLGLLPYPLRPGEESLYFSLLPNATVVFEVEPFFASYNNFPFWTIQDEQLYQEQLPDLQVLDLFRRAATWLFFRRAKHSMLDDRINSFRADRGANTTRVRASIRRLIVARNRLIDQINNSTGINTPIYQLIRGLDKLQDRLVADRERWAGDFNNACQAFLALKPEFGESSRAPPVIKAIWRKVEERTVARARPRER